MKELQMPSSYAAIPAEEQIQIGGGGGFIDFIFCEHRGEQIIAPHRIFQLLIDERRHFIQHHRAL